MAILDAILADLMDGLKNDLTGAGLVKQRGGMARGVAWAEAAGRGVDDAWIELRLHHRPSDRRLQAGLLSYEPMSRGGRTIVIGERSLGYSYDPNEVAHHLGDEVANWLHRISPEMGSRAVAAGRG